MKLLLQLQEDRKRCANSLVKLAYVFLFFCEHMAAEAKETLFSDD